MIPEGIMTWLSPVFKPTQVYQNTFLTELISYYTQAVEEKLGSKPHFALYEYWNFPSSHLISPEQIFEEYWFNDTILKDTFNKTLTFKVTQDTPLEGLLLWINLYVDKNNVLNAFNNTTHWPSVYIPIKPCNLQKGDNIRVNCCSTFDSSQFNPDYYFEVLINGKQHDNIEMGFRDW